LKGKIDNIAHLAGLLVILGIVFIAGIQILYLPLIILTVAALLDEVGNDLIDKKRSKLSDGRLWQKTVLNFFDRRWTMKVAILALVMLQVVPWFFFVAMLFFDEAYILMRWVSNSGHINLRVHLEGSLVRMKDVFSSEKPIEKRPTGVHS